MKKTVKLKIFLASYAVLMIGLLIVASISDEDYLRSKVVMLRSDTVGCSGEVVKAPSGKSYILTAAHCTSVADAQGNMPVYLDDGRKLSSHVIAEDDSSDLLLLEGVPGVEGLTIARTVKPTEHVRTFTHGRMLATYKTEGELIQVVHVEIPIALGDCSSKQPKYKNGSFSFLGIIDIPVCMMSVDEVVSTAQVQPGSSGGMVVNNRAQLVGVVSASDGDFGYFVTLRDIQRFLSAY